MIFNLKPLDIIKNTPLDEKILEIISCEEFSEKALKRKRELPLIKNTEQLMNQCMVDTLVRYYQDYINIIPYQYHEVNKRL